MVPGYRCLPLPPGCTILDRPLDRIECEPCLRVICDRQCEGGGSRPACASSIVVEE